MCLIGIFISLGTRLKKAHSQELTSLFLKIADLDLLHRRNNEVSTRTEVAITRS